MTMIKNLNVNSLLSKFNKSKFESLCSRFFRKKKLIYNNKNYFWLNDFLNIIS